MKAGKRKAVFGFSAPPPTSSSGQTAIVMFALGMFTLGAGRTAIANGAGNDQHCFSISVCARCALIFNIAFRSLVVVFSAAENTNWWFAFWAAPVNVTLPGEGVADDHTVLEPAPVVQS